MLTKELRENNPLCILGYVKEKIGNILMCNNDVTDLTMPTLDDDKYTFEQNWFGCAIEKDRNGNESNAFLIGHCKDTPYFDETIHDQRAIIMMESYIRDFTSSIGNIVVTINVVCHKGFIELSTEDSLLWKKKGYYGNRIDMICQAVYKALTNEEVIHEFGIGKMNLDYHTQQMGSFKPNMYFYGRTMSFLVDEIWLLQERG